MEASNFGKQSVQLLEVAPDGRCLMNRNTLLNLEIVVNKRNGSKSSSLVDLFRPSTAIGKRLLRSTLISPLTDLATIESRHDAVELLLSNEKIFFSLKYLLYVNSIILINYSSLTQ
jgi:DNA mismatch repair ATPase MutS